jgi:hypothetical protein
VRCRNPDEITVAFDDERLVADAGLILPATLAVGLGLCELLDTHVDLGQAPGRANVADKAMTLIHSALTGAAGSTTATGYAPGPPAACWATGCWSPPRSARSCARSPSALATSARKSTVSPEPLFDAEPPASWRRSTRPRRGRAVARRLQALALQPGERVLLLDTDRSAIM